MIHSTHMIPMAHMNYYNNNYKQEPTDYVLDLSVKTKRASSPDYTYGYPSPKFSPNEFVKHSPPRSPSLEDQVRIALSPSGVYSPSPCLSSPKSPQSETSYQSSDIDSSPKCKRRASRPFKSLPKDSVALSSSIIDQLDSPYSSTSFIIDNQEIGPEETKRLIEESAKKYAEFREKMLTQLNNNNNNTNLNMRRMQNNGLQSQDEDYLEKRRKNNQAAKRSRDARRNKQDEIAIRASFLEQENIMLKYKVKSESEDLERLRQMELASSTPASL